VQEIATRFPGVGSQHSASDPSPLSIPPLNFSHRADASDLLRNTVAGAVKERVEHARNWETRYLKLKSNLDYLGVDDFHLYQNIKKWYVDVGNMLTYVNDALTPHGSTISLRTTASKALAAH